jgi:acetyl-CoA carboxylase carboxyl transferase subunit alpha
VPENRHSPASGRDRATGSGWGGARRDPQAAIVSIGEAIGNALGELHGLDRATVRRQRREKFLAMGRNMGKLAGS